MTPLKPRYKHTNKAEVFIGYVDKFDVQFYDRRKSALTSYLVFRHGNPYDRTEQVFIVYLYPPGYRGNMQWQYKACENLYESPVRTTNDLMQQLGAEGVALLNDVAGVVTYGDALDRV